MERTTRLGLAAVGVAVVEGALADWWLRGQTPGLGHAFWVISPVVATAALSRQQQVPLAGEGRWLALLELGPGAGTPGRKRRTGRPAPHAGPVTGPAGKPGAPPDRPGRPGRGN